MTDTIQSVGEDIFIDEEIGDDVEEQVRLAGDFAGYSDDSIGSYIGEIVKIPLLSREEEVDLARKVKEGDEDAKLHFINANLRLVVYHAKKLRGRGVSFMDLVQEGNLGLLHALEKFEPERGFRFSTYASWWVEHYVRRAVDNHARVIRIPVYMIDIINKVNHVERLFIQKEGRRPLLHEFAIEMKMDEDKILEILKLRNSHLIDSMDRPIYDMDKGNLADIIGDDSIESPIDVLIGHEVRGQISQILKACKPREREIIELRFGFRDGVEHTLNEIGQKFGVSRERIRQIESDVLNKMNKQFTSVK